MISNLQRFEISIEENRIWFKNLMLELMFLENSSENFSASEPQFKKKIILDFETRSFYSNA